MWYVVCMSVFVHVCTYIYLFVCTCIHMYIVDAYLELYKCTHINMRACIHKYTYIHKCTHIYKYTSTYTCTHYTPPQKKKTHKPYQVDTNEKYQRLQNYLRKKVMKAGES